METSEKSLGSGMKSETYEPDYPKVGNELFSLFAVVLNNLCKHLPILFAESYDTFYSFFVCLICSLIFNLSSLALSSVCI